MQYYHFIRITDGWIYVFVFVDDHSAFINEFVPGDFTLYVKGHQLMKPITWDQYSSIFNVLSNGDDPAAFIEAILPKEDNHQ